MSAAVSLLPVLATAFSVEMSCSASTLMHPHAEILLLFMLNLGRVLARFVEFFKRLLAAQQLPSRHSSIPHV